MREHAMPIRLRQMLAQDRLPPVTADSIARARAAAEREREEFYLSERQRDSDKLDLLRIVDCWGLEIVERWLNTIKASKGGLSPSTAGDPRR